MNLSDKEIQLIEEFFFHTISDQSRLILHEKIEHSSDFKSEFERYLDLLKCLDNQSKMSKKDFLRSLDDHKPWYIHWFVVSLISLSLLSVLVFGFSQWHNKTEPQKAEIPAQSTGTKGNEKTDTAIIRQETPKEAKKSVPLADGSVIDRKRIAILALGTPRFGGVRSEDFDGSKQIFYNLYEQKKYKELLVKLGRVNDVEIKLMKAVSLFKTERYTEAEKLLTQLTSSAGGLREESEWFLLLCYLVQGKASQFKELARKLYTDPSHSYHSDLQKILKELNKNKISDYNID